MKDGNGDSHDSTSLILMRKDGAIGKGHECSQMETLRNIMSMNKLVNLRTLRNWKLDLQNVLVSDTGLRGVGSNQQCLYSLVCIKVKSLHQIHVPKVEDTCSKEAVHNIGNINGFVGLESRAKKINLFVEVKIKHSTDKTVPS
ncbi:hypothetical protein VNO78_10610 [Psophocarpus tetragonolobus]|uniref:Uncharacterized protein n=1 Tax=Psophocarpus tetragonolobus TaxID=3891 RepID=A0AAN9XME1_PSOTE